MVQVLVVQDERERAFLEHFMLAVLQPLYSDWNVGRGRASLNEMLRIPGHR